MKKLFLFFLIVTIQTVSAQVGVLTPFPKAMFHVDANQDNPKDSSSTSLTDVQKLNDFVVTANGQVGIGTIEPTPSTSLDIAIPLGLRLPQIDSTKKTALNGLLTTDALKSAAEGLLIYNSTDRTVEFYNGSTWISLPITN